MYFVICYLFLVGSFNLAVVFVIITHFYKKIAVIIFTVSIIILLALFCDFYARKQELL